MPEKNQSMMPQSTAGLVRYFDAEAGIKIKPEYIVLVGAIFGGGVMLIRFLV